MSETHSLQVRLNGPRPAILPIPPKWTTHPDPEVDVAVVPFDVTSTEGPAPKFSSFRSDVDTSFRVDLRDTGFIEGDEVYALGFPLGIVGDEQNYAIVRQGIVARIRDWYEGHSKVFLIDSSIFPGNGGGPIIAKPTMFPYGETRPDPKLIGMVSGYLPYQDIAWSRQTGAPKLITEENSGLYSVVPMDMIQETISIAVCRYMDKQASSSKSRHT